MVPKRLLSRMVKGSTVTFAVAYTREENNHRIHGCSLSNDFKKLKEARAAQVRIRRQCPQCYLVRSEMFP